MKIPFVFLITAGLLAGPLGLVSSWSQQESRAIPNETTADDIVRMVHMSRALKKTDLQGVLTKDDREVPFSMKLDEDLIRFTFDNPRQIVNLNINEKAAKLTETVGRSNQPVPAKRYGEGIRGTDLSYDDISFRYLYWPKRVKQPNEETEKTLKCQVVDLYNDQKIGDYGLVRISVSKESGALMRVRCYDWEGLLIKDCKVTSGMKVDGVTMLKTMEVIRYQAGTKKVVGETTFELKKP